MAGIEESVRAYESYLRKELGRELVAEDLARKHEKLAASPFAFLRGTYWRWAETILEVCPDLRKATPVLAVGDIHLENFGTWRDVDGRLVWGVNDFDEAAEMPYVLDLVRLAASALLASLDRDPKRAPSRGMSAAAICSSVLEGYAQGLEAPKAIVLDRDWDWLREMLAVSDKQRAKFWSKIEAAKDEPAPARYRRALAAAMPQPRLDMLTSRRTAGTGSLGRPRWIGVAEWRGAPVVRELKVVLASAWHRGPARNRRAIRCVEIVNGRFRANDRGTGSRAICSCAGYRPTTARSKPTTKASRCSHPTCWVPWDASSPACIWAPAIAAPPLCATSRAARTTGWAPTPSRPPPPSPATTGTGRRWFSPVIWASRATGMVQVNKAARLG